jgi:hypothetical protein
MRELLIKRLLKLSDTSGVYELLETKAYNFDDSMKFYNAIYDELLMICKNASDTYLLELFEAILIINHTK